MTRVEKIEKLEALLARVRSRLVREPMPTLVEPNGGSAEAGLSVDGGLAVDAALSIEVDTSETRAEIASAAKVAEQVVGTTEAPPRPSEHDSRERLVVAEAVPSVHPPHVQSAPPLEAAEGEVAVGGEPSGEQAREKEDSEPPISSRRTVASQPEEQLADMAFGAEEPQPPLHTPPPESGRLPAAAAADFEPESDFRGPRDATPMLPRRSGDSLPRELSPEATRPHRVPNEAVAEVIAEAQRFVPSTFVALLDATLGL